MACLSYLIVSTSTTSKSRRAHHSGDSFSKQEPSLRIALIVASIASALVAILIILGLYLHNRQKQGLQHATGISIAERFACLRSITSPPAGEAPEDQPSATLATRSESRRVNTVLKPPPTFITYPPPMRAIPQRVGELRIHSQPGRSRHYYQTQTGAEKHPASVLLSDNSRPPFKQSRLSGTQRGSDPTMHLTTKNGTSPSSLSELPATETREGKSSCPTSRCGNRVTTLSGPSRGSSRRTTPSSCAEYLPRISKSIPSPSLDIPDDFGLEDLTNSSPRSGHGQSIRRMHTRSCSSSVIILPGRGASNSTSSNGTPLRATASVLSRWRKVRDLGPDLAVSRRNDVFDLLQTISDLTTDDVLDDEGRGSEGHSGRGTSIV